MNDRSLIELAIVFNESLNLVVGLFFDLNALSLVIKFLRFFFDDDLSASSSSSEQNFEVPFSGKRDLVCIFIEVAEIEVGGEGLEDLGNASLEFLEGLGVGGLEDVDLLVVANLEQHEVIIMEMKNWWL